MPIYDELEQLMKLSRAIELEAMAKPDNDDDEKQAEYENDEDENPTVVMDSGMGADQAYDPNPKVDTFVIGSSGTPNKKIQQKEAIFEQEPGTEDQNISSDAENTMECGLGLSMGGLKLHKSLKNGLECCMDLCDPNCDVKYCVGDYVQPKCCETPVILVVKCTDGSNIMTAKPTECAEECGEHGCWPEFSFEQDEIEPMEGITLADIFNVMKFNDRAKTEAFNGGCYDEEPMKKAQKGVEENQRDKKAAKFDDINEFMEDVFGPVKDYTVKEKITAEQPKEQRVKFGFMGAL